MKHLSNVIIWIADHPVRFVLYLIAFYVIVDLVSMTLARYT